MILSQQLDMSSNLGWNSRCKILRSAQDDKGMAQDDKGVVQGDKSSEGQIFVRMVGEFALYRHSSIPLELSGQIFVRMTGEFAP
jgi:hypothetical protein